MVTTAHSVEALQDGKTKSLQWTAQPDDVSYRVIIGADDVKIIVSRPEGEEDAVYQIQSRQASMYEDEKGRQYDATVLMAGAGTILDHMDKSALIIEGTGTLQLGEQVLDIQEAAVIIDGHSYEEGDTVQIGNRTAIVGQTSIRESK